MLKLNEFSHNHHPSGVKMLAKFIRRGFSVVVSLLLNDNTFIQLLIKDFFYYYRK